MAKKKDVNSLTSDELYEMARVREQEEKERIKQEARQQVAELRAERKRTLTRHKRELAQIDAQIEALSGRRSRGSAAKGAQTGISSVVLEILGSVKKASTKELRAELEAKGINTANLAQTLAYLKRTGRVKSTGRGQYGAV